MDLVTSIISILTRITAAEASVGPARPRPSPCRAAEGWTDATESYATSRGTVRQALAQLAADGLVERPEGSAARVRPPAAGETVDAATVAEELAAIRAELREVNSRLSAIEARGEGASTG